MHVDGNAIAGPLSEIFSADMTTALGTCASCGDISALARALVYLKPKAWVVRCHACDAVLVTIVQGGHGTRLEFSGISSLTIPG